MTETAEVIEEVIESTIDETVYTDVVQINGQQNTLKAYRYKVIIDEKTETFVTVLATSGTIARDGIKQQFPNKAFSYDGVSTVIIQCNGHMVL